MEKFQTIVQQVLEEEIKKMEEESWITKDKERDDALKHAICYLKSILEQLK